MIVWLLFALVGLGLVRLAFDIALLGTLRDLVTAVDEVGDIADDIRLGDQVERNREARWEG